METLFKSHYLGRLHSTRISINCPAISRMKVRGSDAIYTALKISSIDSARNQVKKPSDIREMLTVTSTQFSRNKFSRIESFLIATASTARLESRPIVTRICNASMLKQANTWCAEVFINIFDIIISSN